MLAISLFILPARIYSGSFHFGVISAVKDKVEEIQEEKEKQEQPQDNVPTITITSPVDAATVSGVVIVTVAASDDKGISKVEFYVDDILKATDTTSPFSYSWNTVQYSTGTYIVKVTTYDTVNQTATVQLSVIVREPEWEIQTIDATSGAGWGTSLAIDRENNIHIAYYDSGSGPKSLKYAHWTGSSWSVETVAQINESIGIGGPSLVLDSNSSPHIVYYDSWARSSIKYAYWNGTSWTIEKVSDGDSMSNVVMDENNNLYLAYRENGSLVLAKKTGNSWSTEAITAVSGYISIALDTNNSIHIAFGSLKHAYKVGSSWSIQTVDSIGGDNSIITDTNNYPRIAYYDNGPLSVNLKYAYWDGTQWKTETIDSAGDVGKDNSIALNANNNPYISYCDYYPNVDLKFAHWTGSAWSVETVDSEGTTGFFTSLKFDQNGIPCIAYYGNGNLKLARWK